MRRMLRLVQMITAIFPLREYTFWADLQTSMLRSFNYAADSDLAQAVAGHAASAGLLESFVTDWERRTRPTLLAGYREAVRACPACPEDPEAAASLLQLFDLEKAFYELRYELDNRPDRVPVPLGGLMTLLHSDNTCIEHDAFRRIGVSGKSRVMIGSTPGFRKTRRPGER